MEKFYTVLCLLIGYFLGSMNMAYFLSKVKNVDMRTQGSKNLGTSNAMILMGWPAAILVGLHDIGKGMLPVLIAKALLPGDPVVYCASGMMAVVGHVFPFYLKFKGGKGFAAYLGACLGIDLRYGLILCLAVVIATLLTDYIVAGTVVAIFSAPIAVYLLTKNVWAALVMIPCVLLIIYLHRKNFVRIYHKTEQGLRGTATLDRSQFVSKSGPEDQA